MNEWKYQQRRRTRGDRCIILYGTGDGSGIDSMCLTPTYGTSGRLCGCGHRNGPSKRHKRRIIKRALARQLRDELQSEN